MGTVTAVSGVLETLDTAEEKNRSALHSFRDTITRLSSIGVETDDNNHRAFGVQLATLYQVYDNYADELLRERIRQQFETEFANADPDIQSRHAFGGIDNLEFKHCVQPKSRDQVNVQGLIRDLNDVLPEEGGEAVIQFYIDIIDDIIGDVDRKIEQELRSLFDDLSKELSENPTENEWVTTWSTINQHIGKIDKQVRYYGDL